MNHTPEPANYLPRPGQHRPTCTHCTGAPADQTICSCVESCGPRCRGLFEEPFVPPPVPRFRVETQAVTFPFDDDSEFRSFPRDGDTREAVSQS